MLHVEAADKGLIVPRVQLNDSTTAAPVTSPAEGLLIYNETGSEPKGLYYWDSNSNSWVMVGDGAPDTYWDRDAGNGWLFPSTLSDNVGIGDGSPEGKLDVHGRTYIAGNGDVLNDNAPELDLTIDDDETGSNTGLEVPGNDTMTFYAGGNEQARIFPNGVMAVNTNAVVSGQTFYSIGSGNDNAILGSIGGSGSGVRGESAGGTGFGVFGLADNSGTFGMYARNLDGSGTGLFAEGNGVAGNYLIAGSGAALNGTEFGGIGWGQNSSDGIGLFGIGNDVTPVSPNAGAGVAAVGMDFGVYSRADSVPGGIGVIGAGNGETPMSFPAGAGVAGTGATYGVTGIATNTSGDRYGGYFRTDGSAYAYVGGYQGGTAYKIEGTGSVSTIVEDENGNEVTMFAPENPEPVLTDHGQGKLENGKARIELDPTLKENIAVDEEHPLRVFVQVEGDCKGVYVTEKSKDGFTVVELQNGSSSVPFTYKVIANRADEKIEFENGEVMESDYEGLRFPPAMQPPEMQEVPSKGSETKKNEPEGMSDGIEEKVNKGRK